MSDAPADRAANRGAERAIERERRLASRWAPGVPARGSLVFGERRLLGDVHDLSASGARIVLGAADGALLNGAKSVELELELGHERRKLDAAIVRVSPDGERVEIGLAFAPEPEPPPSIDVERVRVDPACAMRVPAAVALRRRVLPMCVTDGRVLVACADLDDVAAIDAIERYFDLPLAPQQAAPEALLTVLRRVYGDARTAVEPTEDDAVALVDELLYSAWLRRASDLHLDTERDHVRVRLRVDGQLEDLRRLPLSMQAELFSRIKVIGGMDIAERRAPQDGRFTHSPLAGVEFDVRVATLPTKHGERATLRLLAADESASSLERLGLSAADFARFERYIARPHGMILATGPTGCGKTTTLSVALQRILSQRAVNAIAVQDPVEYELPGVAQVEVDSARKITFARALRSILRHDPDVILIGEIRDAETLDIALKAALTGHLVLATLHTNSAAGAVTRLIDMGADRFLVAATLRLVIAQRLVRTLCATCRRPLAVTKEQAAALERPDLAGAEAYVPVGCAYCAARGYVGRTGVFELLEVDEAMSRAIAGGVDETSLVALARQRGAPSIVDDAAQKLLAATTSVSEVLESVAI